MSLVGQKPKGSRRANLVRFTLDHAYPNDPWGEIEVTLEAGDGVTSIDVHDWGLPLTSAGGELGPLPSQLASLAAEVDDLRLINLGGDGKRLTAHLGTVGTAAPLADPPTSRHERVSHSTAADLRDAIQIRYRDFALSEGDALTDTALLPVEVGQRATARLLPEGLVRGGESASGFLYFRLPARRPSTLRVDLEAANDVTISRNFVKLKLD